jgi:hypothetical protein
MTWTERKEGRKPCLLLRLEWVEPYSRGIGAPNGTQPIGSADELRDDFGFDRRNLE